MDLDFQRLTATKGRKESKILYVPKTLTFVGAGHRLDRPFVVVVLAHGKRKDAHLSAGGETSRSEEAGPESGERNEKCALCCLHGATAWSRLESLKISSAFSSPPSVNSMMILLQLALDTFI